MADVVGFSRMMGRDDEGTTSRILSFHQGVRATVEAHGGRVVGTAGDSVFGDFDSIVEALDCAVEIQRSLHAENEGRADDERIEVRMGLHLGDVIVEEYDVFGDGVNIASRLEQLADPGGIVLSEAVYQQVKGRRDLPFRDLGIRTLKNIDHPIRVYGLGADAFGGTPGADGPRPPARPPRQRSEINQAMRDAIVERVRHAEAAASEGKVPGIVIRRTPRKGPWTRALGPWTLALAALGVLMVIARTSGWSDTAWYPFGGAVLLSLALGRILAVSTGRRGMRLASLAAGLALGGAFFGSVGARVACWVVAAAVAGRSLQVIAAGAPDDSHHGDAGPPQGESGRVGGEDR